MELSKKDIRTIRNIGVVVVYLMLWFYIISRYTDFDSPLMITFAISINFVCLAIAYILSRRECKPITSEKAIKTLLFGLIAGIIFILLMIIRHGIERLMKYSLYYISFMIPIVTLCLLRYLHKR